jgi:hypothetical protein
MSKNRQAAAAVASQLHSPERVIAPFVPPRGPRNILNCSFKSSIEHPSACRDDGLRALDQFLDLLRVSRLWQGRKGTVTDTHPFVISGLAARSPFQVSATWARIIGPWPLQHRFAVPNAALEALQAKSSHEPAHGQQGHSLQFKTIGSRQVH